MPVGKRVAVAAAICTQVFAAAGPALAQTPLRDAPAAQQTAAGVARVVRPLTLDEAVQLALEQNLDIQVERVNLSIQDENVAMARAAFVPTFLSDVGYTNTATPPDSFLSGALNTLKSDFLLGTVGVEQSLPRAGTRYSFGWDASRFTSNSIFANFDPRLRSNLLFSLTQPLLRNFATDSRRTQLAVSKRNRVISDVDFRATVVQTVRNVKNAYWDLKATIANLEVQRQSLDLARQMLGDNRLRVAAGAMAPLDIVEAEAEVARNEEAVIVAESTIRRAEDRLRTLVFDPATPDFWSMVLQPIDAPQMDGRTIDVESALRNALAKRTDLRSAHYSLDNVAEQLNFYRNQVLPQVDFQIDYGTTGLGGTQFIRDEGFPGPILAQAIRPLGSVLGDVFRLTYPTWTVGLVFSYPLGHSTAEASYARSRLQQNQGELQLKALELQVGTEIRDAGRQVNTNAKRIDASRAARVLFERRLDAEQKKFAVGLSTNFLVFQAQRDFQTARVDELRAILDYNKSLVDFEALQEAPLTGGGIVISGGGSFVATAPGATIATIETQGQPR
jgi:outer membrane protein TolC